MKNERHAILKPLLLCVCAGAGAGACKESWLELSRVDQPTEVEANASSQVVRPLRSSVPRTPTPKVHMQDHLIEAQRLRESVQRGDLAASRDAAAWLAEHELTRPLAENWRRHIDTMQAQAAVARDARELVTAAAAIGMLGEACADCHRELSAFVAIAESQPPTGGDISAQMRLHAWAADQMWLGLIAPSDTAWTRGAEAMAAADLTPQLLFRDKSPSARLLDIEQRAKDIAAEARGITTVATGDTRRGKAYGALIATCSECHSAVAETR